MIYDALIEYDKQNIYPYHMPGHKRQQFGSVLDLIVNMDITEIEGFDNLHDARELIDSAQKRIAKICGAEKSYFLVNGSTAGILSAISATVPINGHILLARNSHKSAYHAMYLRNLVPTYLYPNYDEYGIAYGIRAEQVREALIGNSKIKVVFITSPTYEGRVSEIEKIMEVTTEYKIPLIVDEAHGAHFGFHKSWPVNSNYYRADIVVQSVHKTLPCLTQTALIHQNGKLVNDEQLSKFLRIYQTSSPSYIFLASIDKTIEVVMRKKEILFGTFEKRWINMLKQISTCSHIKVVETDDLGKLVLSVINTNISGRELYEIFLNKYKLQLELSAETYVLAMFTIADTAEGFERMTQAVLEIDKNLIFFEREGFDVEITTIRERSLNLSEAWEAPTEIVGIKESIGKVVADFINLYPPGIPVLVPGEIITENDVKIIKQVFCRGLELQGILRNNNQYKVKVIKN